MIFQMGRKKISNKNRVMSVSLPKYQIDFIKRRPNFNLSKFVQVLLDDYIHMYESIVDNAKGGSNDNG